MTISEFPKSDRILMLERQAELRAQGETDQEMCLTLWLQTFEEKPKPESERLPVTDLNPKT